MFGTVVAVQRLYSCSTPHLITHIPHRIHIFNCQLSIFNYFSLRVLCVFFSAPFVVKCLSVKPHKRIRAEAGLNAFVFVFDVQDSRCSATPLHLQYPISHNRYPTPNSHFQLSIKSSLAPPSQPLFQSYDLRRTGCIFSLSYYQKHWQANWQLRL